MSEDDSLNMVMLGSSFCFILLLTSIYETCHQETLKGEGVAMFLALDFKLIVLHDCQAVSRLRATGRVACYLSYP